MERFIVVSGTYIHKIKKNKELKQEEENNHTKLQLQWLFNLILPYTKTLITLPYFLVPEKNQ